MYEVFQNFIKQVQIARSGWSLQVPTFFIFNFTILLINFLLQILKNSNCIISYLELYIYIKATH
jgi:hypothetical protein